MCGALWQGTATVVRRPRGRHSTLEVQVPWFTLLAFVFSVPLTRNAISTTTTPSSLFSRCSSLRLCVHLDLAMTVQHWCCLRSQNLLSYHTPCTHPASLRHSWCYYTKVPRGSYLYFFGSNHLQLLAIVSCPLPLYSKEQGGPRKLEAEFPPGGCNQDPAPR